MLIIQYTHNYLLEIPLYYVKTLIKCKKKRTHDVNSNLIGAAFGAYFTGHVGVIV